jgi:hypothetical protein
MYNSLLELVDRITVTRPDVTWSLELALSRQICYFV